MHVRDRDETVDSTESEASNQSILLNLDSTVYYFLIFLILTKTVVERPAHWKIYRGNYLNTYCMYDIVCMYVRDVFLYFPGEFRRYKDETETIPEFIATITVKNGQSDNLIRF